MSSQLNITPPESLHAEPITPPLTDEKKPSQAQSIVHFFNSQRMGSSRTTSNPQNIFHLAREALDELFKTLQLNAPLWAYFQDKVRYDYFSQVERFVLRMPSKVHEICVLRLVGQIDSQLEHYRVSGDPRNQAFAKDVCSTGAVDLELPPDGDGHINIHTPDGSFWHLQATWPGVVIEVAFSQSPKDLGRLAWEYISDSDGGIQVVVGLDLAYNTKEATLTVWRPVITTGEDGVRDFDCVRTVYQEFVDSDGNVRADEEQGLCLQLRDFAAIKGVLSDPNAFLEPIFISYRALGEMVLLARQIVVDRQAIILERPVLEPGIRKRKREPRPGAEFMSDDEANWKAREEWDDERSEEKNPEYVDGRQRDGRQRAKQQV
ncbi:MAG: hypothetical protein FRX48_01198 [Lasallia pustulata]|uniref:Uncharacterized protein n=1 Tax=Lasallia pustulata TaxID=136370 RepID=A0A5M8PXH7_9LECA|nr:MAG: hypothetical protein FRX48_01198 [Lasallia pustulata]